MISINYYLSQKSKGILDIDMINYKNVFDTDISLDKKYRLLYLTSDITHAMLLRGYDNQVSLVGCSKSKEKTSTARSPPDAIDATRKKIIGRRVPYLVDRDVHEDLEELQMLLLVSLARGVPRGAVR